MNKFIFIIFAAPLISFAVPAVQCPKTLGGREQITIDDANLAVVNNPESRKFSSDSIARLTRCLSIKKDNVVTLADSKIEANIFIAPFRLANSGELVVACSMNVPAAGTLTHELTWKMDNYDYSATNFLLTENYATVKAGKKRTMAVTCKPHDKFSCDEFSGQEKLDCEKHYLEQMMTTIKRFYEMNNMNAVVYESPQSFAARPKAPTAPAKTGTAK